MTLPHVTTMELVRPTQASLRTTIENVYRIVKNKNKQKENVNITCYLSTIKL